MVNNLERIKDFFDADIKIKEELYNLVPTEQDQYSEETKIKYMDRVVEASKYIKRMLEKIESEFNLSTEKSAISNFFNRFNTAVAEFNYKNGDLKKLYQKILSDMDEKLVSEVNENCVGYTVFTSPYGLVEKCNTVNELLHVYHSYIVNNEHFYKSIPKQYEPKINQEGYDITLYGLDNDLAKEIFERFPLDMDCGDVDILALENRILMMLRDRGHALTIELMQTEDGKITIKYFIPKICNVEMVNQLKGVTKVDDQSRFAKGMFESERVEVIDELFTFINGVPMDKDMILKPINMDIVYNNDDTNDEKTEKESGEDDFVIPREEIADLSNKRTLSKIKDAFKNVIGTVKNLGRNLDKNEYTRDE